MKYIKICENCGKEFQTNRENQKYCNQYCAGRARHKRQEEKSSLYSSYKTMQENEQQSVNELTQINYNDEIVITTKTLAEVYEAEVKQIQQNFNNNQDKFIKGKHYYKLEGEELKEYKRLLEKIEQPLYQEIKFAPVLYLWTKRGASRHCKMLGTDKAWDMFDVLEENYFNPKTSQLSKEDEAWLAIHRAEQYENTQYLINAAIDKITGVYTEIINEAIDGEGRKITLSQLAKSLEKEIEMEVKTGYISDFLFLKGYLVKRFFQRIDNNTGKLSYKHDLRGLPTRTPWMERQAHKQPTNKFMDEFANKGLALTKDPDARGKIMWEFTDRFDNYFKQNFLKEFIYFIQNKKGWK